MVDKTISYKGKRIKVNERDRVLYTMVKQKHITEEQMLRLQRAIPESTSASQTVIDVRKNVQSGMVPMASGAVVPEGEVRPGVLTNAATGTAALDKYRSDSAIAAHRMMDAGLIDFDEAAELLLKADEGFDIDETYGLAAYIFEITPDELVAKLPDVSSIEQVVATGESLSSKAGRLQTAITQPVGKSVDIVADMGGWLNQWYDDYSKGTERGKAAEEELTEVIETLRERGDIAASTLDRLQGEIDMATILNDEDAKAIADEIAGFDLATELDPSTLTTLRQYTLTPAEKTAEEAAGEVTDSQRTLAYDVANQDTERRAELESRRGAYPTVGPAVGNNLRTVADFAAYQGIIPPDQRPDLNVTVEGGGLEPFFEHDIPENYFYDSATSQAYHAQKYERLLQGQLAYRRGYQRILGADGLPLAGTVMDEYEEAMTAPLGERGLKAQRLYRAFAAQGGYAAKATYGPGSMSDWQAGTVLDFDSATDPWLRQSWSGLHPGSARVMADNMTTVERRRYEKEFAANGLDLVFSEDDGSPIFRNPNTDAQFVQMLGVATQVSRGQDISPFAAIGVLGVEMQRQRSLQQSMLAAARNFANAMTPQRQPFQVPAGLRSVPDKREIAQDVKDRFRIKLGRDPTEVELADLASELTGYHQQSNREQIDLAYAEWEGTSEIMDGADLEEVISNPALVSTYEMEEKWANEINLNERQEINSDAFSRMRLATGGGASLGSTPAAGTDNIIRV